jgi:hypothetical protein
VVPTHWCGLPVIGLIANDDTENNNRNSKSAGNFMP